MNNVNDILNNNKLIISVMGPHADESTEYIFERKNEEIKNTGKSFWFTGSYTAKPEIIREFCGNEDIYCIFISPSSKGGAKDTKNKIKAKEYSEDNKIWKLIPEGIIVTGKIGIGGALVFNEYSIIEDQEIIIDLWQYLLTSGNPFRTKIGASTICCIKKYNEGMKSRYRNIIAVGRLTYPFAVWLR